MNQKTNSFVKLSAVIIFLTFISITLTISGQTSINTDGSQADASAMLDIQSTERGFLPPRMNTAQRDDIDNPATGLLIFNTDSACIEHFDGSEWNDLCTGNSKAPQGTPSANGPEGVGMTADGSIADPSAMLDVKADDLGFLMPRMTTAQRDDIYSPATGLLIYNTDSTCPEMYDGTYWYDFCTSNSKAPQGSPTSNSAGGIAITPDGSLADTSAMLEVKSTEKGFLMPRMTTAGRDAIANPAEGLMIYNTDDNEINFFDGTSWMSLTPPSWTCGDDLTDARDGKVYGTVLIGSQCWMKENLNIGTRIDGANDQTDNGTIEKYCYDDDENNCDVYGGLYQWDEMMQYVTTEGVQGICPTGWHIPTDEEWKILEGNADTQYGVGDPEWDGTSYRGYDAGKRLKTTTGWHQNSGTNAVGFSALPGGYRYTDGGFYLLGDECHWWSATAYGSSGAWFRNLSYDNAKVLRYHFSVLGYSVRCLRD